MTFIEATNVIASRPPDRRPTGTPHARAKTTAHFFSDTLYITLYTCILFCSYTLYMHTRILSHLHFLVLKENENSAPLLSLFVGGVFRLPPAKNSYYPLQFGGVGGLEDMF